MKNDEWTTIEMLLEECWPGGWTENTGPAYRVMLGGYPAEALVAALRKIAAGGCRFRPSVGEVIGALEEDPGVPSWPEVWAALYGERSVLFPAVPRGAYATEEHYWVLRDAETARLLSEAHPLLAGFVGLLGASDLRLRPIHGEYAGAERARLQKSWEAYSAGEEVRRAHRDTLGGPKHLAPLAAHLGRRELGSGS